MTDVFKYSKSVAQTIVDSERIDQLIHAQLGRLTTSFDKQPRKLYVVAACQLAFDHHQAILELLRRRLSGPALALVRPILDVTDVAFWLTYLADNAEFKRFYKGQKTASSIQNAIRHATKRLSFAKSFERPKQLKDYTDDLTHGGVQQISRKFKPTGELASNYKPENMIYALGHATGRCTHAAAIIYDVYGADESLATNVYDLHAELFQEHFSKEIGQ